MKLLHGNYRAIFGDSMEFVAVVPAKEKKNGGPKKPRYFLRAKGVSIAVNSRELINKISDMCGALSEKERGAVSEKVSDKKPVSEKKPETKLPENSLEKSEKKPETKLSENSPEKSEKVPEKVPGKKTDIWEGW